MTEDETYLRAVKYAEQRGTTNGANAAGWYLQDVLRSTRDGVALRRILQGIEDGDPETLDALPAPYALPDWRRSMIRTYHVRSGILCRVCRSYVVRLVTPTGAPVVYCPHCDRKDNDR